MTDIQRKFIYGNATVGVAGNVLLSLLILTDSRAIKDGYGRMLLIIATYNIYYAIMHCVVDIGFYVDDVGFLMFSKRLHVYGFWPSYVAVMVYVDAFTMSITLLAIHCLYRFVKVSGKWKFLFQDWRCLCVICFLHFLLGFLWVLCCDFSMRPSMESELLRKEALMEMYDVDMHGLGYIAPVYAWTYPNGTYAIQWKNTIGSIGCMGILAVSYFVILLGCFKVFYHVHRSAISEKTKRLHYQLLRLLFVQAIVPLIFEYIPCFMTVWGGVVGLPNYVAKNVPVFTSMYAIFDSIVVILFFPAYRRRIARFFVSGWNHACNKNQVVSSTVGSGSGGHDQSTTGKATNLKKTY